MCVSTSYLNPDQKLLRSVQGWEQSSSKVLWKYVLYFFGNPADKLTS